MYTPIVGWRTRASIGVLVLTALVVAPVSAALCAVGCASGTSHLVRAAAARSAPHGSPRADCHDASPLTGVQLSAASHHTCGDHGRIGEDATASLLPGRDDTSRVLQTAAHTVSAVTADVGQLALTPPHGASRDIRPLLAPPAISHRTLVLRI
ncbi:MAG: hypothetical protein ACRD2X_12915 [Vicinamibacteraceae bacterium]